MTDHDSDGCQTRPRTTTTTTTRSWRNDLLDGDLGWTSNNTTDHDGDGCHRQREDEDDDNDFSDVNDL